MKQSLTMHEGKANVDYPNDQPYPSRLLFFMIKLELIHAVEAQVEKGYACYVVTAFVPSPELWHAYFRTRK